MRERIATTESDLKDLQARIQAAEFDAGLKNQLLEEKALTESRLARLKIRLQAIDPGYRPPNSAAAAPPGGNH